MDQVCQACGTEPVAAGLCDSCRLAMADTAGRRAVLEAIDAPVLLMQGEPRQVLTANGRALRLFAKELAQVEAHRGGQVFDCLHSFTAAGCGKDVNCEHCPIKGAIVDTFVTAASHQGVAATLPVVKAGAPGFRALQVSTEKIGDLALVRIERYDNAEDAGPPAST